MLDDRMKMMLEAADTLTEEDLEFLRSDGVVVAAAAPKRTARTCTPQVVEAAGGEKVEDLSSSAVPAPHECATPTTSGPAGANKRPKRIRKQCGIPPSAASLASAGPTTPISAGPATGSSSRGAYERERTRESKVSTACLGTERDKHEWWPLGTELVARIGGEEFTAEVAENPSVKSGLSVLITSGPAKGKLCITPTRAAIEATEVYRQSRNLGRGGGVTNGWTFWKPRGGSQ